MVGSTRMSQKSFVDFFESKPLTTKSRKSKPKRVGLVVNLDPDSCISVLQSHNHNSSATGRRTESRSKPFCTLLFRLEEYQGNVTWCRPYNILKFNE